jgi:hypothetical protein
VAAPAAHGRDTWSIQTASYDHTAASATRVKGCARAVHLCRCDTSRVSICTPTSHLRCQSSRPSRAGAGTGTSDRTFIGHIDTLGPLDRQSETSQFAVWPPRPQGGPTPIWLAGVQIEPRHRGQSFPNVVPMRIHTFWPVVSVVVAWPVGFVVIVIAILLLALRDQLFSRREGR